MVGRSSGIFNLGGLQFLAMGVCFRCCYPLLGLVIWQLYGVALAAPLFLRC